MIKKKLEPPKDVSELDAKTPRELIIHQTYPVELEIDENFARQVAEFIKEYRPALEALAKK